MTTPELSLIIPAFNEAERLPPYLVSIRQYCNEIWASRYEVLVVDDGSSDGLAKVVDEHWPQLRLLRHEDNRGKGAAVRRGMLAARGRWLLFADADGATPIEEEARLRRDLEAGADVAVGSRLVRGRDVSCARPWHRKLAGRLFAGVARRVFGLSVHDTQCGFKMFRRDAGRRLFQLCRENGYLFDLELLFWARHLGYAIAEVPISWHEVPGSKMSLARDGVGMATGLFRLRRSLTARAVEVTRNECRRDHVRDESRHEQGAKVAAHPLAAGVLPPPRGAGRGAALVAAGSADPVL